MAVNERRKIELRTMLERFLNDSTATEIEFPANLSNVERALIHRQCQQCGLQSKSKGGGFDRYLMVYKRRKINSIGENGIWCIPDVHWNDTALADQVAEFLRLSPLTQTEHEQLTSRNLYQSFQMSYVGSRLLSSDPGIPALPKTSQISAQILETKSGLPIQNCRGNFVEILQRGQVILILGETGSGKSTQIPQFILEHASETSTACRVIVAEPRRIAAISLAERVAIERGERVGDVVGYHIRLASRLSSRTLLTYCTNGVLLKAVVTEPEFFKSVTHIIIDEIHERDKFSDFLLIILRDILPQYPKLNVILMSASLEKELLGQYFPTCFFLDVPGRTYAVDNYFLADVLFITNYISSILKKRRITRPGSLLSASTITGNNSSSVTTIDTSNYSTNASKVDWVDKLFDQIWSCGSTVGAVSAQLSSFLDLISSGGADVNYQHSRTGATLLMIVAGLGLSEMVDVLLARNADSSLVSANGWQALHWALALGNDACVTRLNSVDQPIVDVYHSLMDDDQIDIGLILELLVYICCQLPSGAVLVFLPGYDDIMQVKEAIRTDSRLNNSDLFLCMLHSQMRGYEQRRAFDPVPDGKRKIVLSTNIAEVSITLEDVCYVIDTGKMKQRGYDALNDVSTISTTWISKTNAIQRTGRAGRCRDGICFHLYSEVRFNAMPEKTPPEILRVPIHELCLQTKLLKPDLRSVAEFLKKAPESPSEELLYSSIQLLKDIGAFDADERLTVLGRCLIELPVDPQYGKMILYGAMLQCLDPVLTIVASLTYGDPFSLPRERSLADNAVKRRFELGQQTAFSDHGVLVNALHGWEGARASNRERNFSSKYFLSNGAMEMIVGIKGLLLRALQSLGFGGGFTSHEQFVAHFNVYSRFWPMVKAALTAGAYPNIALVDKVSGRLRTKTETAVINASSVLLCSGDSKQVSRGGRNRDLVDLPSEWAIFNEMCRQNGVMQTRCITSVSSTGLALFAGPAKLSMSSVTHDRIVNTDNECWDSDEDGIEVRDVAILKIDDWLKVRMETQIAERLIEFRQKLHVFFLKQMQNPSQPLTEADQNLLALLFYIIMEGER